MAANTIPAILINARVYDSGRTLLGIGDAEIGDLEYMTESLAGLGIAGELDLPVMGHLKSMSLKIKWNTPGVDLVSLMAPKAHQLSIYASIQNWEYDNGAFAAAPCRLSCRAFPKKAGIGKFEPGKKMEPESEFELTYLKMSIAGKEVLELDKVNMIGKIGDTDYLENVRSQLGQ